MYIVSGRSRGGSIEPLFWRAAFENTMCKVQTYYVRYTPTLRALISPAPYADNQLLCSLWEPKCSHAFNSWNTTTRFSSRFVIQLFFTPKLHQKQSQRVRNPKNFLRGMSPDPSSRRTKRALIASWNPPIQILDPPLIVIDYPHIPLQWIVPPQKNKYITHLLLPFEQARRTHEHLYMCML